MPKRLALAIGALVVLLAGAQLLPVRRTNPPVTAAIRPPQEVRAVLDRCCIDCHTNRTSWPWYAHLAPTSWLVVHDVKVGRENFNFSYWEAMTAAAQRTSAKAVVEQLGAGSMPLWYYLLLHRKARPSPAEVHLLRAWFSSPEATPGPRADSLGIPPGAGGGPWDDDLDTR